MPILTGFADAALHPNVLEALKALAKIEDAHTHALDGVETQYLKSLDVAYDDQAEAVRELFVRRAVAYAPTHPVKARFA